MRVGSVVIKRGKDLDSGKNIADYLDKNGRMDCVSFYHDHGKILNTLSTLWVVTQCESSRRVVEVGCERFSIFLDMYRLQNEQVLVFATMSGLQCLGALLIMSILTQNGWQGNILPVQREELGRRLIQRIL